MGDANRKAGNNQALIVALAIVAGCFWMSRDPDQTTPAQRKALAAKFHFTERALPVIPGIPRRNVRPTNPSCERIAAWVSSFGAGVTLADLDGDGLPNDLIYTDPRTEQVIVCPAPGTTPRYPPFALTVGGNGKPNVGSSGTLVGDFNEDGRPDILVHFLGRAPLLFLRKPGTSPALSAADFTATELAGDLEDARWFTTCAAQADLDGDGHVDLVFGNFFPDQSETYDPHATSVQQMHNSHGWAYNGGGLHFLLSKQPTPADPHWFREVPVNIPERELHGWVLGLAVADLNGDFLPDIYCANDLGPDHLFANQSTPGHLRFATLMGEEGFATPGAFSVGRDTYHGMGCDVFDLNGDGIPDIFVSNVTCEFGIQESQMLWMSRTKGAGFREGVAPYEQDSEKWGVSRSGWAWDAKFESFANTVMPDIIQATGMIRGEANRWPELQSLSAGNTAFLPDPRNWPKFDTKADISGDDLDAFFTYGTDGQYHNINQEVGLGLPMVSRGIATADVDGDGRMDFALANMWGPSYFFRNDSPQVGSFLGLRLVMPPAGSPQPFQVLPGRPPMHGRPAFGAVARVLLPCGRILFREVDGGNGHTGRRSPELHFGLGNLTPKEKLLEVSVRWRRVDGTLAPPVNLRLAADGWYTVVLGPQVKEPSSR